MARLLLVVYRLSVPARFRDLDLFRLSRRSFCRSYGVCFRLELEPSCNDHCLCSGSQGVRRQVRWGGCGIGTVSRVLGKAMDRFQCTWIAMIGKLYELIVEYLGNGSGRNLLVI